MLHEIREVADDLEWLPMNAAGVTVVIGELTVSGI